MAFDVGSVVAHIKADLSDFEQGISKAKSEASSLGSRLSGLSDGIVSFSQKATLVATGATVAFGAFAFKTGMAAAKIDELTLALHAVAKANNISSEAADKAVSSLRANNVAYKESLNSVLKLISAGIDLDKNANHLAENAKNLAIGYMGSSEAFDLLTDAIVTNNTQQLSSLGVVTTQTMAFEKYAKVIGKSASDLNSQERQLAIMNVIFEEGEKRVGAYDAAMGSASKKWGSFITRILPDFIALIGQVFEPSLFKGVTILSDGVKKLSELFTANAETIKQWGNNVITEIDKIIASPFVQSLIVGLQELGKWVVENKELVVKFFISFGAAIATLVVLGTVISLIGIIMNPISLLIIALTALYTAWQTNFLGIRDITTSVIENIKWFIDNVLTPAFQIFSDWFTNVLAPAIVAVWQGFIMPLFQAFVLWFQERWEFIRMIIEGVWKVISGIIELYVVTIIGIINAGLQILSGNWSGAWQSIVNMSRNQWNAIEKIFSGALSFVTGWAGAIFHELVRPFEDAWHAIQDLVNKIKDALDFTKRHSPSVVDIVNRGVSEVNRALGGLNYGINVTPHAAAVVGNNGRTAYANVTVNLEGALIGNEYSALAIGEKVGDAIIKKLQLNLKI